MKRRRFFVDLDLMEVWTDYDGVTVGVVKRVVERTSVRYATGSPPAVLPPYEVTLELEFTS